MFQISFICEHFTSDCNLEIEISYKKLFLRVLIAVEEKPGATVAAEAPTHADIAKGCAANFVCGGDESV
jgi:hypothetical protein